MEESVLYEKGDAGAAAETDDVELGEIAELYEKEEAISLDALPCTDPADHTMVDALPGYIVRKVPTEFINAHLQATLLEREGRTRPFLVLGVYDPHFEKPYCQSRRWHVEKLLKDFSKEDHKWGEGKTGRDRQQKHFYLHRPKLYKILDLATKESFYALVVFPGRDYVEHYASMVRCGFEILEPRCTVEKGAECLLRVLWYPKAFEEMPRWCGLSEFEFRPGDVILMGYVAFLRWWMTQEPWYEQQTCKTEPNKWEEHEACGFSVGLQKKYGYRIILFGFHYSFWGDIAKRLVQHFCECGVSEVIYFGKCATLRKEADIHSIIVSPTTYGVCSAGNLVHEVRSPPFNPFSEHRFAADLLVLKGSHVSVPTIIGETFEQRDAIGQSYQTLDNEISQMAQVASEKGLRFGCLHFCTDFVRPRDQAGDTTRNDLNRNQHAEEKILMPKIFHELLVYLGSMYVK